MSLPNTILPIDEVEKQNFRKNPKVWIEGKLEQVRPFSPLLQSVFNSIIKNNLSNHDFYLFLSFYSIDRIIKLEHRLEALSESYTNIFVVKPTKRIKLPERIN